MCDSVCQTTYDDDNIVCILYCLFFFKQKTAYELRISDWSSDVCSSDLLSEKSASWMVEGIGEDFLPTISDFSRVKKAYAISDKESFLAARELLEKEGILGGSSTGTLLAAALRYCREQTTPKRSEARSVGKECVSTCRYRWSPDQ